MSSALDSLFTLIQKACLPGVWSKGVALAQESSVIEDSRKPDELILRVLLKNRPVSPKVSLWPADGDYYCDCGDRVEPCAHVAAAIIAVKNGKLGTKAAENVASTTGQLVYRFTRENGALSFDRWVVRGEGSERLNGTLVSQLGGIYSGRVGSAPIIASKEDFAVDMALSDAKRGVLERATLTRLFSALKEVSRVELDGKPVRVSSSLAAVRARLADDGPGFRLQVVEENSISEVFKNGALLCGEVLRVMEDPGLTPEERELLSPPGRWFGPHDTRDLVTRILPALERKIPVEITTGKLPRAEAGRPYIILELEKESDETLEVLPRLVYDSEFSIPDPAAERQLTHKLRSELQLAPGHRVRFQGDSAVEAVTRFARSEDWELVGPGRAAFATIEGLRPRLEIRETGLEASFESSGTSLPFARVWQAWEEGRSYVPLLDGGYAKLPQDWLDRYGKRVSELLAARTAREGLSACHLPELADLSDELGLELPNRLRELREKLEQGKGIPEAPLPANLGAILRSYQRQGVDWLCFLRDSGLGAMLADDMGLGKTLQALCAIRGRTLVVCPTSVLQSWAEQIERFRSDLKFSLYYGSARRLNVASPITLTTYAMLRLDRETLTAPEWDTVVLDEAQFIKNPDSQVARAAHELRAKFRLTLSGTPVENRLEDLWSQFRFLNPGLLGMREAFRERFERAIDAGDSDAAILLRRRIRPFILRRLKKDVAPELPPRTETVLECELTDAERELYQSLLVASRAEVLAKLEAGGSVFGALELLLRLRQACCHSALVPGQSAESSSKVELLLETLETSRELGHRALIFSQWTSYLDLIEPGLRRRGIDFLRLDGSTSDRAGVVARFQDPAGPPVMLISLKAGGVGLTLTAADHIFLMDPWWNPAAEDQAADRAHRIGQDNPVLIHRLVAKDTIESRILELQKRKIQVSRAALDHSEGEAPIGTVDRDELIALLQ